MTSSQDLPFLGPVDPLEEDVPEELWPPGDGKLGLLYGTSASSRKAKQSKINTNKVLEIGINKLFIYAHHTHLYLSFVLLYSMTILPKKKHN